MRARDAEVPCPTEGAVVAFFADDLEPAARKSLLTHLADCAACCELFGALVTHGSAVPSSRGAVPEPKDELRERYRIDDVLGFGGHGIVYSATDRRLERRVAVKLLWAGADEAATARLQREARVMAKLDHPHVVRVLDVGDEHGRTFVAMELVAGGTLRGWLATPRPWREVLARFAQAGEGLAAAHRAGLVHRDFKPDNALVRPDGTVLVSDFGLAREVPAGALLASHGGRPGTAERAGTLAYMAPEQLRGEAVDLRADVFAFAVALWEGLYGARPFALGTVDEMLDRIARGPSAPADRRGVPVGMEAALRAGLALRRRDRPSSIGELLTACRRAAEPGRGRAAAIVGGTIAVAVTIALVRARNVGEVTTTAAVLPVVTASEGPMASIVVAPSASTEAPAPSATTSIRASAPVRSVPSVARLRPAQLRGMQFEPIGFHADEAAAVVRAHEADFAPCLSDACADVTCRFEVDGTGSVAKATCAPWEGAPPCTATQACIESKIRALKFPTPGKDGESVLFFDRR
jgi:hypothetical protein